MCTNSLVAQELSKPTADGALVWHYCEMACLISGALEGDNSEINSRVAR